MTSTYRILLLGDFHFGESYSQGRIISRYGYRHSFTHLHEFVGAADYTVVNLETPVVDPEATQSPLIQQKKYVHWSDPEFSPSHLRWLGVDAVSLANNHSMDYGVDGLLSTFQHLEAVGISWFGAGRNLSEASSALTVPIPRKFGSGELRLSGMYQYLRPSARNGFYADASTPGTAPLGPEHLENVLVSNPEHNFDIAFPHWGSNYREVTNRQTSLAPLLIEAGYDAIVGHGAHCLQPFDIVQNAPVFYGIGNGVFNSPGRFASIDDEQRILPYAAWTVIEVHKEDTKRWVTARLYPVYPNNRKTGYTPAPIHERDVKQVTTFFEESSPKNAFQADRDELGFFLEFNLGEWSVLQPPNYPIEPSPESIQLLSDTVTELDIPQPWDGLPPLNKYDDSTSVEVLRQMHQYRRMSGTVILAEAAAKGGAEVQWLANNLAVADTGDRKILLSAHRGPDSPVGAALVKNKLLAKMLLLEAGVATPRGRAVKSPEEAISFQAEVDAPVVIKPRSGNTGKGVTVNLSEPAEIHQAFSTASKYGDVIVEEFIDMVSEYRCLATPERCISVTQRLLPTVEGNGKSTIEELIRAKNTERKGLVSGFKRLTPLDAVTVRTLRAQGYELSGILPKGKRITVRNVGGLSSGGEAYERSGDASQDVKHLAAAATAAIPGLHWAGTDIIVARDGTPYVIEINTSADIAGATFPLYGSPVPVGDILWQELLRPEPELRHPTSIAPLKLPARVDASVPVDLDDALPLDQLFAAMLTHSGVRVDEYPNGVRRVANGDSEHWFSRVAGAYERSASTALLRRHGIVLPLLKDRGIAVPLVHFNVTPKNLAQKTNSLNGNWVVVDEQRQWPGRERLIARAPQELTVSDLNNCQRPMLQQLVEGQLFRVLSSRQGALAILSPTKESKIDLRQVSALATQTIREVPHLQFGTVDIIGSKTLLRRPTLAVEGFLRNPRIYSDWWVVGGSFDHVWEYLLGEPIV